MNILIVGAGPTGLTTALELVRQGITPEIVDAKDAPSLTSRAVAVLSRSIEILDRTGVGKRIASEGMQITRARIHRGQRALLDIDMSAILDETEYIVGIAQDRTETIMSEELERRGGSVRYGTKVQSVSTLGTSAEVTFQNGEKKTYDWVIGADGVNSTVRDSLAISYTGYELAEEWSIADVELHSKGAHNTINAWLLAGENRTRDAMVMFPIEENRVRLISSTPDSLAAVPMELDVKNVRRSGTFTIAVRQAETYVHDRVLLAGDAAHAHSPVGGRGMNLGIEDGQAVASALISGNLEEYERERKAKAQRIIKGTERARKLVTSNNPFIVVVIYIVAWCIQHISFIRKKFITNITSL